MRGSARGPAALAVLLALAAPACRPAPASPKKLIEFGWDEPDTRFLRRHLARMERTPFDGCVFHVNYKTADGRAGNLAWQGFGRWAIGEEDVREAREDLRALPLRRFTHNFLRFNTTPGSVDWFEDFTAIRANARLAADLARDGRAAGILFDVEQYEAPLFTYRSLAGSSQRSFRDYAAQVRLRGRELMQAFQEGYPGLTVMLTFGHSLPWRLSEEGRRPLAETHYGLLAPFVDGLLDAAEGGTRVVDGHELSYGYRHPSDFSRAREAMKRGVLPIVADPRQHARHGRAAFGIWMDFDWRHEGWYADDPGRNYFTPAVFEQAVSRALALTDEYVWIYVETPRWWTDEGVSRDLPRPYVTALRRARAAHGLR